MSLYFLFFFFFFQAEDGIRDADVMEFRRVLFRSYIESKLDRDHEDFELTVTSAGLTSPLKTPRQYKKFEGKEIEVLSKKGIKYKGVLKSSDETEIGRASCRERV